MKRKTSTSERIQRNPQRKQREHPEKNNQEYKTKNQNF